MKIAVCGAAGRMGQTIVRLAAAAADIEVVGAADGPSSPNLGRDVGELSGAGNLGVAIDGDLAAALLGAEVLIDFTIAEAFAGVARAAMRAGVALVSGTTRLSADDHALLDRAAASIPVLWAPNMSVGVQVLARLVRQAVAALGAEYDVEVIETHHNKKADAPSGTATFLVQAATAARPELSPVYGREGQVGARRPDEIGVHAIRGGGVVGDHTVHLIGEYDRIEIGHRAMRRELFAAGALRAARWLVGRPAGLYTMDDVIGDGGA